MQVTPLYPSTPWPVVTGITPPGRVADVPRLGGSGWDGLWAAYDAETRFTPSVQPITWPLYDPTGNVTGNTPSQPSAVTPTDFRDRVPGWMQDLVWMASSPFDTLFTPATPSILAVSGAPPLGASLALSELASSYDYDTLAASSPYPSEELANGDLLTPLGLDLWA